MNTVSCPRCNLVTLTTAISCKRCDLVFETIGQARQTPETIAQLSSEADFTERQNSILAFSEAVQSVAASSSPERKNRHRQNQQNQSSEDCDYRNFQFSGKNKKIGLAIASTILGIVGFSPLSVFLGVFISSLLGAIFGTIGFIIGGTLTLAVIPSGLILGVVALRRANKYRREYGGKGFAVAGIACSAVGLLVLPLVAVIAIPNLMAARHAANESSAVSEMRKLAGAEEKYMTSMAGRCGDASSLFAARLIDADSAKGEKNGYRFMIVNLPAGGCEIHAVPLSATQGGRSFYYATEDKLIRWAKKDGKLANKNDKLLGSDETEFSENKENAVIIKPNESAAMSALRTLHGAEITYMATAGQGKCGDLQSLANQGLIKQSLADGEDQGYRFIFNKMPSDNWEIIAVPLSVSTGARSFYISQDGVLRGASKNGLAAGKSDPPVDL